MSCNEAEVHPGSGRLDPPPRFPSWHYAACAAAGTAHFSPVRDDPIQNRLPDQLVGVSRKDIIGMPEVNRPLVFGLELHREFRDVGTGCQRGRVVARLSESSRCAGEKDGNGDLAEMVVERHRDGIAEQRVGVEIASHR